MKKLSYGIGAAALLSLGACAEGPANNVDNFGYNGTGISFGVSPLTLDSLADACYSFAVENGDVTPQLVVGRGPNAAATFGALVSGTAAETICASQFGNGAGGDISYVAPCDADDGVDANTVTLWVDALCTGAVTDKTALPELLGGAPDAICPEMQDYVNPCGTAGCSLQVTCAENADTPVNFNFTIMGQADQGFFDLAVNFDDVFCSAKFDTCNTDNLPIQVIFDDAGNRMDSFVAAISCTAGPDTATSLPETFLTHSVLTATCSDGSGGNLNTYTIDAEGNFDLNGLNGAAYFGTESLSGVNKVYTNFAFGIPTDANCTFRWEVVPSNGAWTNPGGTNTFNSYGKVVFNVAGVGEGSKGCTTFPLDGQPGTSQLNGEAADSGVNTVYATGDFAADSQINEGAEDIVQWP